MAPNSPAGTAENALRSLRGLKRCPSDPVILTGRGPRYRGALPSGTGLPQPRAEAFGLRSRVERFFGFLEDRTRVFYNNINPKKTLFVPHVSFLELFTHWYTE